MLSAWTEGKHERASFGASQKKASKEYFYDSLTLPNRRFHERANDEYFPLQVAKLRNKIRDRLTFTIKFT